MEVNCESRDVFLATSSQTALTL